MTEPSETMDAAIVLGAALAGKMFKLCVGQDLAVTLNALSYLASAQLAQAAEGDEAEARNHLATLQAQIRDMLAVDCAAVREDGRAVI